MLLNEKQPSAYLPTDMLLLDPIVSQPREEGLSLLPLSSQVRTNRPYWLEPMCWHGPPSHGMPRLGGRTVRRGLGSISGLAGHQMHSNPMTLPRDKVASPAGVINAMSGATEMPFWRRAAGAVCIELQFTVGTSSRTTPGLRHVCGSQSWCFVGSLLASPKAQDYLGVTCTESATDSYIP